jgi:hypothetical protein
VNIHKIEMTHGGMARVVNPALGVLTFLIVRLMDKFAVFSKTVRFVKSERASRPVRRRLVPVSKSMSSYVTGVVDLSPVTEVSIRRAGKDMHTYLHSFVVLRW